MGKYNRHARNEKWDDTQSEKNSYLIQKISNDFEYFDGFGGFDDSDDFEFDVKIL